MCAPFAAVVHGIGDEPPARPIERAVLAQRGIREQRIQRTAPMLPLPRREDTLTDRNPRLAGRNMQRCLRCECWHLDVNINAI